MTCEDVDERLPIFEIEVTHIGPEMTTFRVWSWYEGESRSNCGILTMYHDEYLAFVHRFFSDDPIEVRVKELNHTFELMKAAQVGPTEHFYPRLKT